MAFSEFSSPLTTHFIHTILHTLFNREEKAPPTTCMLTEKIKMTPELLSATEVTPVSPTATAFLRDCPPSLQLLAFI